MVKLQVALDLTDLELALRVANEVVRGGADILEVGTPLLKKYGVVAVERVRARCPDIELLADSKTADAGRVEAEIMFGAGADMMTVLGLADDATAVAAREVAESYGGSVVVDLMNVKSPHSRALELWRLGLRDFCFHTGLDAQRRGRRAPSLLGEVDALKARVGEARVFVAGGIRLEDLEEVLRHPVDVVIVGGAILRSPDPEAATRSFKRELERALG